MRLCVYIYIFTNTIYSYFRFKLSSSFLAYFCMPSFFLTFTWCTVDLSETLFLSSVSVKHMTELTNKCHLTFIYHIYQKKNDIPTQQQETIQFHILQPKNKDAEISHKFHLLQMAQISRLNGSDHAGQPDIRVTRRACLQEYLLLTWVFTGLGSYSVHTFIFDELILKNNIVYVAMAAVFYGVLSLQEKKVINWLHVVLTCKSDHKACLIYSLCSYKWIICNNFPSIKN